MLGIAEELMLKASDIYIEQFARLGVFSKVESLASSVVPVTDSYAGEYFLYLLASGKIFLDVHSPFPILLSVPALDF